MGPLDRAGRVHSARRAGKGRLIARAAAGDGFLGQSFPRPLRWLYFTREGSASFARHKFEKVADALGLDAGARARVYLVERGGDCRVRLSRPADVDAIRRVIAGVKSADGARRGDVSNGGTAPIQLMWSNRDHGPAGPGGAITTLEASATALGSLGLRCRPVS